MADYNDYIYYDYNDYILMILTINFFNKMRILKKFIVYHNSFDTHLYIIFFT